MEQRYPHAAGAILGGSVATGHWSATSDLDVVVLLTEEFEEVAFVETSTFEGQLVEAFVYGPAAWLFWTEKGRAERRPVLDSIVANGVALTDGPLTSACQRDSQLVLDAGPGAPEPDDLNRRRYGLSALIDDLEGAADAAEAHVIAATAWREAAELVLLDRRSWLGTGKWLVRQLRAGGAHPLIEWAEAGVDHRSLIATCRDVLDALGGYLQSGYLRGTKPTAS